ncbi:MAG: PilZ domain-containing protein [Candidatus Omnitrophota bacterium]
MVKIEQERRKYSRYDTEMKIYYQVTYDIRTKVKFQVLDSENHKISLRKYSGLSKNISAEGLCFVTKKKLNKGDMVLLEVYVPNVRKPVQMEGRVQWTKKIPREPRHKGMYHTGVKLVLIDGKPVNQSIHFDKKYNIFWDTVLDAVFGSFRKMVRKIKKNKKDKNKK